MSLTLTRTHASPATLGGIGFQVESRDDRTITVQATGGHRLTPAGVVAVTSAYSSYLSGLSATNAATTLDTVRRISISSGGATLPVQNADVVTVASTLTGILTTAGNVTRG